MDPVWLLTLHMIVAVPSEEGPQPGDLLEYLPVGYTEELDECRAIGDILAQRLRDVSGGGVMRGGAVLVIDSCRLIPREVADAMGDAKAWGSPADRGWTDGVLD